MRWYLLQHGISSLLITKNLFFWIFWGWKIWHFWAKKLMERWYLLITKKFLFNLFDNGKYGFFLSLKVDGKMIFTGYWKGLVLNFLLMGNTVFFWVKKLMKRWYLLVTENFLFWTFWWWEIRSFFQPKFRWKDDIYMVFLSFLWYSRTWEIWFFAQCVFIWDHLWISLFFWEFFCLWESLLIVRTFWNFYHLCQSMSLWK